MNFFRRFGKSSGSKKNKKSLDSNTVIKKVLFYGFLYFTTANIISKKYKAKLIYTFEPTRENMSKLQQIPVFQKGEYCPTYYMLWGPLQRFYVKYLEENPFFRPIVTPSSNQHFQLYELPIQEKYVKRENIPIAIVVSSSLGIDNGTKNFMTSTNNSGFKTIGINLDDVHDSQKFQKTLLQIREKYPNTRMYGVGTQYGANILINHAASDKNIFKAIVSIANPLDLQKSEKNLQNSLIWKKLLYEDILKSRLNRCRQKKQKFGQVLKISTDKINLYELDKHCYSKYTPQMNYHQLKQQLSSVNKIKDLKIPSLFVQSQQSPFSVPISDYEEQIQNENCIFVETQRGGHAEWLQSMKKARWASIPVTQFFRYHERQYTKDQKQTHQQID